MVAVIVVVLWKMPQWQVPSGITDVKERAELEDQFRRTIAQIVFGAAVLAGVYVAWRRASAIERNVAVTQEGQITERFTRAIDQLGSDNTAICLGGIYALERIARDSPERDHRQVMEVLTAYVREQVRLEEGRQAESDQESHRVPTTIQAILTVLGRRDRRYEQSGFHLNLSNTNLFRANLSGAHLEGADLIEAHLEQADLRGAHLEGAELWGATGLTRAQIESAHMDDRTMLPDYPRDGEDADEDPPAE